MNTSGRVTHWDGSTGVVLPAIDSTGAGEDMAGNWCIPVCWETGIQARKYKSDVQRLRGGFVQVSDLIEWN